MKFHAALQDMVTWLETKKEAVVAMEPVSGQIDTLTRQKLENEVSIKKMQNNYGDCVYSIAILERSTYR